MAFFNGLCALQGCTVIFDNCKSLKMKGIGKSHFPVPSLKKSMEGCFQHPVRFWPGMIQTDTPDYPTGEGGQQPPKPKTPHGTPWQQKTRLEEANNFAWPARTTLDHAWILHATPDSWRRLS